MNSKFSHVRREYRMGLLLEKDLPANPLTLFEQWLSEAIDAGSPEATAMVLSSCTANGKPSSRVVLLKDASEKGFSFFTNSESRKGKELQANPHASLVFFWPLVERQVRIEGKTERVPPEEADTYFRSRPIGSQLGSWASPQSQVIASREILDNNLAEIKRKFEGRSIPRPDHWGGYRLLPQLVEFWQGRENRLHDRLRFVRKNKGWKLERLAP